MNPSGKGGVLGVSGEGGNCWGRGKGIKTLKNSFPFEALKFQKG